MTGSALRRAFVEVDPDVEGLDASLQAKLRKADPGGKAGKQVGGQLNRALKRFDLDPIDIKADPKSALAGIAVAEARLRELSGQAATVEVKIQTEKALGQLARFRKQIGDVTADAGPEAATGFTTSLVGRLGPLLAKMPISPPLIAALGAAGAAGAPLLAAAISSAVVGAAGVGGVVGGLALARRDERVEAEIKGLGDRLERRLLTAAGGFVQPALAGIKEIDRALATVDIEGIFRDSAKYVPALTAGVSSAITDLGDGVEALVANANGPVQVIARGIAGIGDHVGSALESMASNADVASSALDTLFGVMNSTVDSTANLVGMLTTLYDWTQKLGGESGLQLILRATGASTKDLTAETKALTLSQIDASSGIRLTGDAAADLKIRQEALTVAQKAATSAQDALSASLDAMAPKQGRAADLSNNLRTASQNLFGAAIAGTEANEAYATSWDALSVSVKSNKGSLDLNTAAGRANRDSLQGLLGASNEMYFANVAQGQSTDSARKKHETRTEAVRKEARQLGLNKTETDKLIATYGKIPGRKETDLVLDGMNTVVEALNRLYWAQRALAEGKTVEQIRKTGLSFTGHADGGWTGPGSKYQPAGIVHADEYVIKKESRQKLERANPGLLQEMNATGQLPGHAAGGQVAPVDTSRSWPYKVNVSKTYLMSMEQALAKVAPKFGDWPSSPSAQRGDSGVWKRVLQLIKSGPKMGSFGNAYRPGDPKWHGSGRAIDWMGFNMDPLASYLASKRPLELIHRTRKRDYAYTRGKNQGSFSEGLMNAHRNHIHIAMDDGGFRTLQPGMNLIPNGTGKPEPIAGPQAMAAMAGGGMDVGALIAELRAVRSAIERNGDVVGQHVRRGVGGVDARMGAAVDLYARTA